MLCVLSVAGHKGRALAPRSNDTKSDCVLGSTGGNTPFIFTFCVCALRSEELLGYRVFFDHVSPRGQTQVMRLETGVLIQ